MQFTDAYPERPPRCVFDPTVFHPNIYSDGAVCVSILGGSWCPAITVKQILICIQELLNDPNRHSAANGDANAKFCQNVAEYHRILREQARKYKDPNMS